MRPACRSAAAVYSSGSIAPVYAELRMRDTRARTIALDQDWWTSLDRVGARARAAGPWNGHRARGLLGHVPGHRALQGRAGRGVAARPRRAAAPDQVAQVLDSVRTDGLAATYQKVTERLATPQPLGYSLAGTILEVGEDCEGFHVGMPRRVRWRYGQPRRGRRGAQELVVPIPHGVPMHDACFATLASIPLHAIRVGRSRSAIAFLVIGLGLMGQLAARLCACAGARVFGVDPDKSRADLALRWSAERIDTRLDRSTALQVLDWSRGRGADVVLITAEARTAGPSAWRGRRRANRAKVSWWARSASTFRGELLREGAPARGLAVYGPGGTTPRSRRRDTPTLRATCPGRSGATWRRSSICFGAAGSRWMGFGAPPFLRARAAGVRAPDVRVAADLDRARLWVGGRRTW
jgi:hypothetical protein